jgi:hypothetical protein
MLSAIETNVAIICACLPSMRPLLTSMMPVYFPEGSQSNNTHRYDVEQPKHVRYHSGSSRPDTADSFVKPDHSRSGSSVSQGYIQPYSASRGHSRSGSTGPLYHTTGPARSQSVSANHSRTCSITDHSRTPSNSSRLNIPAETELQPLPNQHAVSLSNHNTASQLNVNNGHQHPMNPLRMSPFSPVIPASPTRKHGRLGPIAPPRPIDSHPSLPQAVAHHPAAWTSERATVPDQSPRSGDVTNDAVPWTSTRTAQLGCKVSHTTTAPRPEVCVLGLIFLFRCHLSKLS